MDVLSCVGWIIDDDDDEIWLRWCYSMIIIDFKLRSWDSLSYNFLVNCLQEFKVLECLIMLIEI